MSNRLRVGCVPYLNAKPLIEWFHSPDCDSDAGVAYQVPSTLAQELREGTLDVALVSSFELFRNPELEVLPGMSIAADGPVKSVRLFSTVPFDQIRTVALDTSSLTSSALVRILLKERYGLSPNYVPHPPDLDGMLAACDAGLVIGDLKLFDTPAKHIMDLGAEWKAVTGLPFVYAAWLARPGAATESTTELLLRAKAWGELRLEELAQKWSVRLELSLSRTRDYLVNIMRYGLDACQWEGLLAFQQRCARHGLIEFARPLRSPEAA